MGQDGKNYRKAYDPRFAVSFVDSGPVNYIRPSYIRSCAFHNGFSPAIGIFNALYLPIEDNVIHGSHFYGKEGSYLCRSLTISFIINVICSKLR